MSREQYANRQSFRKQLLAGPYLIWIIGFILLPLAMILYYALTTSAGTLTLSNILAIGTPIHRKALYLSIRLALICTIICLFLSYPLAMILSKLKNRYKNLIVFIFILPMWMNFMLRILSWKILLSNSGVFNTILGILGLPELHVLNTPGAVVFCMVYDFLPFMILPIYNSMSRISKEVLEAAKDLGANQCIIFFKIILPLTFSGVVSGIIMVFVPALTSFAISDIIGGGKVLLIGNVIEQAFMQEYNWQLGSGLSFVLMIFVVVSMTVMNTHKAEGGNRVW